MYFWDADNWNNYEDASSQSSMNSYKFSNMTFIDREQEVVEEEEEGRNSTRRNISIKKCNKKNNHDGDDEVKMMMMNRVKSMVDLRSQLLHRSLVEEMNKRRMFNTVGAVENIGYYDPAGNSLAKKGGGGGRSVRNNISSPRGFEW